jgi:DNA-binding response OmpR family regulator
MKKVLLAEDDIDFATVLKQYLEIHQFEVRWAKDGEEALHLFKSQDFDICIFDVMMPKIDGFTLAEKCILLKPEIPFLFLTARNQSEDKIKGLKLGADDYIVKPFEADELVLRLTNILKRASKKTIETATNNIQIGLYLFDTKRLELRTDNSKQQLTEKEAALLTFLYQNKNQLLKREEILRSVWHNEDYFSGRSMDVYISKLRKYFADDKTISIESIRNIGLEFKIKKADL